MDSGLDQAMEEIQDDVVRGMEELGQTKEDGSPLCYLCVGRASTCKKEGTYRFER